MDGNRDLHRPIDFDAYKERAHELRRQEIDRLFGLLAAKLFARRPPQHRTSHPTPVGAQPSRC